MVKSPSSFEVACCDTLRSTLVTVTVIPGTTPPDGSVTRPTTVADGVCASREKEQTRNRIDVDLMASPPGLLYYTSFALCCKRQAFVNGVYRISVATFEH